MTEKGAAEIAVIIPHYNDPERLRRCLSALLSDPDSAGAEIVVVDNQSDKDLTDLHIAFPAVTFLVEPLRGAAAARNRGVGETQAPMLFFTDADCVPQPGWIAAGRTALDTADIVGGSVELFDETPPPRSGAQSFEAVFAFNQKDYVEKKGFSVSANLLTWRHVFKEVGDFRQGVSEDVDWCHRALKKRFCLVYDPRVLVTHPSRATLAELKRKWQRVVSETFALQTQSPFPRVRWAVRAGLVLASPMLDLRKILLSARLRTPAERALGIATLFYLRVLRAGWMFRQVLGWRI
ncbi:glycosyltransferase [Microvirga terricola]|uniref:Glycosyltransferase n=1 Tax=Microvirga terricola TaxID=2719797 RepID=A0ABX0VBB8_9HYPH|nr:glycosyltransferase [Microvirga terricola]